MVQECHFVKDVIGFPCYDDLENPSSSNNITDHSEIIDFVSGAAMESV
jgi:hypothetical protein